MNTLRGYGGREKVLDDHIKRYIYICYIMYKEYYYYSGWMEGGREQAAGRSDYYFYYYYYQSTITIVVTININGAE